MKKEQFVRERDYGAVMSIAKSLLKQGCITGKEYRKIRAVFLRKYLPVIGTLQAEST